jgi:hypothetical protein
MVFPGAATAAWGVARCDGELASQRGRSEPAVLARPVGLNIYWLNLSLHAQSTQSYKLFLSRQVFFSDAILFIIAAKMIPRDQKNGLERHVSRFCTILVCDKNQPLNEKN